MKIEIKIPAMGESISEATIGAIIKPSGSLVAIDDELIELETDKVNQVLYAPQAGVVSWNIAKDAVVKIGQVIGYIDTDKASSKPQSKESESQKVAASAKPVATSSLADIKPAQQQEPFITKAPGRTDRQKSAEESSARESKAEFLADLKEPEVSKIEPAQLPVASPQTGAPPAVGARAEIRKKMSRIRSVIAKRLVEVRQQTAMLTTFNEVDMTNIMTLRDTYKDTFSKKYNVKLGFMSFFVKASAAALKAFPDFNAYINNDEIVYRQYIDIGVAVGTDRGVIVPVLRNCDTLAFPDIERSIEGYAKKARDGTIGPDDLQGGGFTITNGGVYGSLLSTPILSPSQCAILGMHKIAPRPVVVDGEIVIRQMMYLALSYDHRIVDGKDAVSFLVNIKNYLEDPSRLLLEI